ncbi:unnamed protein product [Lampetra fluviatilis]
MLSYDQSSFHRRHKPWSIHCCMDDPRSLLRLLTILQSNKEALWPLQTLRVGQAAREMKYGGGGGGGAGMSARRHRSAQGKRQWAASRASLAHALTAKTHHDADLGSVQQQLAEEAAEARRYRGSRRGLE